MTELSSEPTSSAITTSEPSVFANLPKTPPPAQALAEQHCTRNAARLPADWVQSLIEQSLPQWLAIFPSQDTDSPPSWAISLTREYSFTDYFHVLAFVNAVAPFIHREDHHPSITFGFKRCRVEWSTHDCNGVSLNDAICAAKTDAIFNRLNAMPKTAFESKSATNPDA